MAGNEKLANREEKQVAKLLHRPLGLFIMMALVAIILTLFLEPGLSLFLVFAVLPVISIRWWVQQQQIEAMAKCVKHFTQVRGKDVT